ncbi:hypothetical protein M3661_25435 [Paenibacillus sp. MER 180]|uniref:hypothetical protein n=1 Tax=Paenibacillus sp. MER 180 TaxID=2939570 RepID=UPI00203FD58F|nr:hypothetical protein [Paenibacillus sp. MER 180]MCM3293452.1 hypothetical protein [Paenibacillus sp. MER 180]
MYKRILNSLLCIILILALFPIDAYGDIGGGANDGVVGTGQLGLRFDEETGILHYEALNKTAGSGIRFKSVGWILRADTTCDDNEEPKPPKPKPPLKPLTAQCTPLEGDDYVRLEFDEFGLSTLNQTAFLRDNLL